jgi:hypothetical protein
MGIAWGGLAEGLFLKRGFDMEAELVERVEKHNGYRDCFLIRYYDNARLVSGLSNMDGCLVGGEPRFALSHMHIVRCTRLCAE